MSATSSVSPDFSVFSRTRPFFRLRILTLLVAWPLPGLRYSLSMTEYGSPSISTLVPDFISLVLTEDMGWFAFSEFRDRDVASFYRDVERPDPVKWARMITQ